MSGLSWGESVRRKRCEGYRWGGLRGASKVGGRGPGEENETKRCEKLLKFNRIKK